MEVFPTTHALQVFANDAGGITLIQGDALGNPEETIVIPPIHVEAVIRALRLAKKAALED